MRSRTRLSSSLKVTSSTSFCRLPKVYDYAAEFTELLKQALDRLTFDIDFDSDGSAEASYYGIELLRALLDSDFTVIKIGGQEIVAAFNCLLTAKVTADFTFSVYDSVDKETIPIDSGQHERTVELDAELLATFSGDFDTKAWSVSDVEVSSIPDSVDFEYAGPAVSEEEEDL